MLDSSLVDLVSFNTAYLHKRHLRLGVIVCYEISTGEVQLFGTTLKDVRQFWYKLCQFDCFADLIFCDTEKFCYQLSVIIPLAVFAKGGVIVGVSRPLAILAKGLLLYRSNFYFSRPAMLGMPFHAQ